MCVTVVGEAKNASELIHSQVPNVPNLKLWRLEKSNSYSVRYFLDFRTSTNLRTHLKLYNLNFVGYYGWFIALVERCIEHLNCIIVKLVRKSWPVESERHGMVELI